MFGALLLSLFSVLCSLFAYSLIQLFFAPIFIFVNTFRVVFELLWRDFFRFFGVKHGNSIFFLDGTLGKEAHGSHPNSRRWGLPKKQLEAWKNGLTGYPLVDANMRELAATGFMSNRGRQNVASFLALELNCDWRYGADHFESLLLDYDVYSNWGNWCSAAGMTGGEFFFLKMFGITFVSFISYSFIYLRCFLFLFQGGSIVSTL